jgi:hypothetical protein
MIVQVSAAMTPKASTDLEFKPGYRLFWMFFLLFSSISPGEF